MNAPRLTRFSFATLAILIFALAAASATRAQTTSASTQPTGPIAAATPPKKVWTNDNLVHSQPEDSSTAQSDSHPGSAAPAKSKPRKDAKWYHDQIAKLQAQIPPFDKTIAELQTVLDGKTPNEPLHDGGNRIGDWKEQLEKLQAKRQDTLDKIADLEDEARHDGVATNALPVAPLNLQVEKRSPEV